MIANHAQLTYFVMSAWLAEDRPCDYPACTLLAELKINVAYTEVRFFFCIRHGIERWKHLEERGRPFNISSEALEVITRHPRRLRLVVLNANHKPQGCCAAAQRGQHPCLSAGPAL